VADEPNTSVVIACYTEDRWSLLAAAVESALQQTLPAAEVVVVVDHNPALATRVEKRWPSVRVVPNDYGRGASGARNTGASRVSTDVVAFLDDDAVAEPTWLERLVVHLEDPSVVGVGGGVMPAWERGRPTWFPDEFGWVIGVSYPGLPESVGEVRNVWAENMAVRRTRFDEVGGFRLNFGKVGSHSSPEDTDLCIRMAADGGRWLYVPDARVAHHVPVGRSTLGFFFRRCFQEGTGKAALSDLSEADALTSERRYTREVLPRAVTHNILLTVRRKRIEPAVQAALITAGLVTTAAGFAWQKARRLRSPTAADKDGVR
jgi:GT2 family glycosyltransferase